MDTHLHGGLKTASFCFMVFVVGAAEYFRVIESVHAVESSLPAVMKSYEFNQDNPHLVHQTGNDTLGLLTNPGVFASVSGSLDQFDKTAGLRYNISN